jgi:deoxyribodipyrimidine photo-lyase
MILFIHRKDLRTYDMSAFDYIYSLHTPSIHLLIIDPYLFKHGREKEHSGINFLRHARRLKELYEVNEQQLYIIYGDPYEAVERLFQKQRIEAVVLQEDFTPYALIRDHNLEELAAQYGVRFTPLTDHLLANPVGLQEHSGRAEPYKVFTPYYKKWSDYLHTYPRPASHLSIKDLQTVIIEGDIWQGMELPFDLMAYDAAKDPEDALCTFLDEQLTAYASERDHYAVEGTSKLSRHINVGAISIRRIYEAIQLRNDAEPWRRQLAWRDFYLYQSVYDQDFYRYETMFDLSSLTTQHFESWKQAKTGIPIVDATMTELNETGHMPNRLRMITAMFLTKNLQCPFTLGEQYFRLKLCDYDNALNRGGWLWCASLGFDASPYFRIMNPVTQSQTHDPSGRYIRRWLPELDHLSDKEIHLPLKHAIVDLKASRAAAIDLYKNILR